MAIFTYDWNAGTPACLYCMRPRGIAVKRVCLCALPLYVAWPFHYCMQKIFCQDVHILCSVKWGGDDALSHANQIYGIFQRFYVFLWHWNIQLSFDDMTRWIARQRPVFCRHVIISSLNYINIKTLIWRNQFTGIQLIKAHSTGLIGGGLHACSQWNAPKAGFFQSCLMLLTVKCFHIKLVATSVINSFLLVFALSGIYSPIWHDAVSMKTNYK